LIIPDVNVLMYAAVDGFAQHERARSWWQGSLSSGVSVGLAPAVVYGFVRLATNPRVLVEPMTLDQALALIGQWLDRPEVEYLPAGRRHLDLALGLLHDAGAAGNLTTDAQIAAHAVERDGMVATNDTDFARFPGVRCVNPLDS
jgi:toxin-antitoxin system PIN domain toxin